MQVVEFEADILKDVIKIPAGYREKLKNRHIKVLALYSEEEQQQKNKMSEWNEVKKHLGSFDIESIDPVQWQRKERAEWDSRI